MASVKLDTVRNGVKLLSGLLKEADFQGNESGKVSKRELRDFIDNWGDGGSLDDALKKVYRYAQAKYGTQAPSIQELNRALADAMRNAAKADKDHSKTLSVSERRALATTWKAVVEFAKDYRGSSVSDILHPQSAP
ncbi:MAG: hypothetical protein HYZ28_02025 [Myxococcales bacterium]|nr:hypothetical protein [Myxococcales bacterium]